MRKLEFEEIKLIQETVERTMSHYQISLPEATEFFYQSLTYNRIIESPTPITGAVSAQALFDLFLGDMLLFYLNDAPIDANDSRRDVEVLISHFNYLDLAEELRCLTGLDGVKLMDVFKYYSIFERVNVDQGAFDSPSHIAETIYRHIRDRYPLIWNGNA